MRAVGRQDGAVVILKADQVSVFGEQEYRTLQPTATQRQSKTIKITDSLKPISTKKVTVLKSFGNTLIWGSECGCLTLFTDT